MATTALHMTVNPMILNRNGYNDSPKKALNGTSLRKAAGRKKLVKRDPITGEGASSKEPNDFGRISNNPDRIARKAFNEELIKWNSDEERTPIVERPKASHVKSAQERNPVSMQGDLGKEIDALMTTNRPRVGTPRDPIRNPINGNGNFGQREWDPVWKYAGKIRRAKSTTNDRSNPLTGDNTTGYVVSIEEKSRNCMTPRANRANTPRNILTGENCETYTVSTELKDKQSKRENTKRNTLTGENCKSYEINIENANKVLNRSLTMNLKKSNPLSGENVNSFDVSLEQRPKSSKPYIYSNTVTGENRTSYKINPNERNITSRSSSNLQNPVNGDNVKSYTYRSDEKAKNIKIRDLKNIASPLTGGGSRGLSYSVSVEEKKNSPNTSSLSTRNILTGENCQTYMVSQEMRSERKPAANNGYYSPQISTRPLRNANYNIITGEDK